MSFTIQLSSDLISVEAGDNTPVNLTVSNRGEEVDRFEVEVEGLDPEWTAIPVPLFSVAAGENQTEKVFFRPGRASESLAGNYPFVVKVRSLNSGDTRSAQGVLQIKPYNHLSMEITPKKGSVSPVKGLEIFHASVINLGNTEQMLQLYGSDPEDAFAYEFGQEQVSVGPGQQKEIEVKATPTSPRPFSSPRLHVFTISARSIQSPALVASSQAQLEQRPVVTPGTLAVVVLLLLVAFGWFLSRPQAPTLDTLTFDREPASYQVGDMITIRWHSAHADSVKLVINSQTQNEAPSGTFTFQAQASGTVEAIAVEDRTQSKPIVQQYDVTQPKVPPAAEILSFDVSPHEVKLGDSVMVSYSVNDATTKVILGPSATVLPPKLEKYQVKPDQAGTIEYQLFAENSSGKSVKSKVIKVRVIQASQAHVVYFDVAPKEVDPIDGKVQVSWQTTGAARAMLFVNGASTALPDVSGQSTIQIDRDTEYYIEAFDSDGVAVRSQKKSVKLKVPPPPTTGTGETNTTGATTTTTAGSTTGNNNPQPTTGGGG
jgi:hypothetical protein